MNPAHCPRCGVSLDPPMPKVGEVWLRVDTGRLYEIVGKQSDGAPYWVADRMHPRGPQGCDTEWKVGIYRDGVLLGKWLRVEVMP